MKNGGNSSFKRMIALLLSLVMILSIVPIVNKTTALAVEQQIADNGTMDSWKEFFDPDNITTAHAGGIWTDKSVFTASPFQKITIDQGNFQVVLSAMGSNSVVVGKTYAPTDTVFVLDVSNSMSSSALSSMVTATNNAIRTLLEGEDNTNRVGVVLYGTNANVLLPLDHYTGVSVNGVETFIELSGSNIRAARSRVLVGSTAPEKPDWWDEDRWGTFPPSWWPEDNQSQYETVYLKNSAGGNVTTSVSTGGGTYIQGGLWKAWQEFNNATVNTTEARVPALVLMSDGAPTYSASDFDNVPDRSNWGTGSNSYDGDGFVTQLTAAYVKAKMAEKYSTTAYFYTLGLDVEDIAIAEAVLNPKEDQTTNLASLWTRYLALANGSTISVNMRNDNGSRSVSIDKVAAVTSSNYVDRYFAASQASNLNQQFQNIVNEIGLSAGYYPTHLDDSGVNYSGYITFVDEIGRGMRVKKVDGIVIGDTVYTGELMARALNTGVLGTKEEPTAMGDEFVRAVKARLGLTENQEVWALLDYAYNTRKSLYYDAATNQWSNYIVWYGDADGNYLGYDESLEATAVYRNACYGMLGSADGTHQASDMMYVAIQVSTNLATGDQTVTFRVPASMLPVVTYQISIDGDHVTENTTATLTYKPAEPIRLVYEVGVREDMSDLELLQYAKEVGGKYYLYTNNWNENPDLTNIANNRLTYAYFEPGADNEHYYFTDDSVIYSAENTGSTVNANTSLNANGTYYYRHYAFRGNMSTKQVDPATGNITVSAAPDFHFEQLSSEAIRAAVADSDGLWAVPKGTMHFAHSHDLLKDDPNTQVNENYTGTFAYVREQIVDAKVDRQNNGAHHYELVYMGNNGRVQVEPTQGILLSKQMADSTAPAESFVFDVKLTGLTETITAKLVYVDASGVQAAPVDQTVTTAGELTVQLKAGEAVYIYDIPAGTGYTVTERENDGYHQVGASGATGTVADNAFSAVAFTNEKTVYSELNVVKSVTYQKGASDANEANKPFTVTVKLTKGGAPYAGKTVYVNGDEKTTDANGQVIFQITDKDTVKITNIPVGVQYAVTESDLPDGYTWTNSTDTAALQGQITVAGANVVLLNTYTPDDLTVSDIVISLTKKLVDAAGDPVATWPESFSFTVSRWNGTDWDPVQTESRTQDSQSGNANIARQLFTEAGTYYFRIKEEVGSRPGMTYDRSFHDFAVTVTDTDLDGKLELASVASVQGAEVEQSGNSWVVKTTFSNIYEVGSTKLTFAGVKNLTGRNLKDGEFTFELYQVADDTYSIPQGTTPIQTIKNGAKGDIIFEPITYAGNNAADTYYYVIKEAIPAEAVNNQLAGVTYTQQEYKIAVTVSDVSGNLTVTNVKVNGEDKTVADNILSGVDFENSYSVSSIRVPLEIHKIVRGNTAQRDFSFRMVQLDSQGQPMNNSFQWPNQTNPLVWNGNEGAITILEDISAAGELRFRITEIVPDDAVNGVYKGVTYDPAVYDVVITTTDNGDGTLSSAVTVNGVSTNVVTFTNTYSAAGVTGVVLNGHKTLTGDPGTNRPMKEGEFSFTLTGNGVHETVTNNADGSFSFGGLTFNTAGDYEFTITENNTGLGGVIYVQNPVTVTVNVTDNGEGQLVAMVDGKPVAEYVAAFVNTYSVKDGHLSLEGFKELIGAEGTDRPLQAGDFTFTLTDTHGHTFTYLEGTAEKTGSSLTAVNGADGKIVFPTILYDAVGTHTYTITESKLADGTNGITYDKVVYTLTVEVTDNQAGYLSAKITKIEAKTGEDDAHVKHVIDFFNSYRAEPVSVILAGNKVLENVTPGIAESEKNIPLTGENLTKFPFSFQLEAVTENAPLPNGTVNGMCVVQSVENGVITFPAITFEAVGEYKYTVKEVIPDSSVNGVLNGVTYTVQTHEITVEVTDNQSGQLQTKVFVGTTEKTVDASGKAADALSFKNTYKAEPPVDEQYPVPGSVALGGNKQLQNITAGIAAADRNMTVGKDQFFFELRQGDDLIQTVGTKDDGSFLFGALVFDSLGEFTYTIAEVDGGKGYITYADPVTVKVTVTDTDLDGWMEIKVTYADQDSLTVINKYEAQSTQLKLTGVKEMDKRDPRADEFSFILKAVEDAPMPDTAVDGAVTVKNNARGEIIFPEITYDTIGVYHYTVEEVLGVDGTNGVIFDNGVYDVTVTVSDGGDGELVAVAGSVKQGETEQSDVVFFNKYQPAPVEFVFSGTKTLVGRDLVDGEFTFLLKDAEGKVLQSVTNKDGKFAFEALELLAAGSYTFTIKEDTSSEMTGITYDTTEHKITVVVKDDGMGQLKAYIQDEETDKAGVSFTNIFTTETTGGDEPPKTSDTAQPFAMMLAMLLSAVALVAVQLQAKKKRYTGHFVRK